MPEFTCPTCDQLVQGDECLRCRAATSIRKDAPHIFRRWLPTLIVVVIVLTCAGLLIPAAQKVKEAERRTHAINNMKQIGVSIHAYHDVNRRLPSPKMITSKDGKLVELELSWRVAIDPYIEKTLFPKKFDYAKGWDHPIHEHLHDEMPPIYDSPRMNNTPSTRLACFQYFTGPDTLFSKNETRSLTDIKDGADRTLLFAEAAEPVLWMRPADMAIRPNEPLPIPDGAFLAATVAGNVRYLQRDKIEDSVLRQLIHPNDQKPEEGWDN